MGTPKRFISQSLRVNPAMAAGVSDHVRTLEVYPVSWSSKYYLALAMLAGASAIAQTPDGLKPYVSEDARVLALDHVRVIDGTGAAAAEDQRIDIVGATSSWMMGRRSTRPASRRPFHVISKATRIPPSHVCRFDPCSGALLEPLTVVVGMVGPPLSFRKITSVFSSSFRARRASSALPIASSIAETMAA
jgi:hypothetical protein